MPIRRYLLPLLLPLLLLPPSAVAAQVHCSTPDFLALRGTAMSSNRNYRPSDAGFVDSDIYPLRIHYSTPGDDVRVRNVILPAAEDAFHQTVEVQGWPVPPPSSKNWSKTAWMPAAGPSSSTSRTAALD